METRHLLLGLALAGSIGLSLAVLEPEDASVSSTVAPAVRKPSTVQPRPASVLPPAIPPDEEGRIRDLFPVVIPQDTPPLAPPPPPIPEAPPPVEAAPPPPPPPPPFTYIGRAVDTAGVASIFLSDGQSTTFIVKTGETFGQYKVVSQTSDSLQLLRVSDNTTHILSVESFTP